MNKEEEMKNVKFSIGDIVAYYSHTLIVLSVTKNKLILTDNDVTWHVPAIDCQILKRAE